MRISLWSIFEYPRKNGIYFEKIAMHKSIIPINAIKIIFVFENSSSYLVPYHKRIAQNNKVNPVITARNISIGSYSSPLY